MKPFPRSAWSDIGLPTAGVVATIAAIMLATFVGCSRETPQEIATASASTLESDSSPKSKHASTGHSHIAPHGGQVQAVGDNHFELVYDSNRGSFTLYVLGSEEMQAEPIPEQEITLLLQKELSSQFVSLSLVAEPLVDTAGRSSRFFGTDPQLAKLDNFTALVRVPVAGEPHRVLFQFVGGRPISAGFGPVKGFACPMNCEKGKVYPKLGKCPVCKMKLQEALGGKVAHFDHNPKHGGIFFMAPDKWHHLEGTLPSAHELRIYLYDNFTRPMDATGYSGELKVQPVDDQDEEVGQPVTVPIRPVPGKPYLAAKLPKTLKPPYQTEARLKFPNHKQKFLFNFDFHRVQHKE